MPKKFRLLWIWLKSANLINTKTWYVFISAAGEVSLLYLTILLQESLDYEHPTVSFYDINQELFDCPNAKEPACRTLHYTTLLVEDGDEGEVIDDEAMPQWMDDKLMNVVGEDDFNLDADVDLDASELCDILADTPLQVLKVPEKAMEMAVDGENAILDGEDAVFNWM